MKAICVSNDPKGLADHQQSRAVETESEYPLKIGEVYPVLGMTIAERAFYFLVRDDTGGPCFAHAGFFDLFTASIPAGWRFGLEPGIRASGRGLWSEPAVATWGYPELVDDPAHVQALLECDPSALALFASYAAEADAQA